MFPIDVLACGRVGGLEVVRGAGTRGLGRLDVEGGEVQPGTIISQHHIIMTSVSCDLIMHTSELVFLRDQEQESPPPT